MPPNRDWLDILVATFTVSTGVVIALAALLALVVQRARYLKEIEPDLRLGMPNFLSIGPSGLQFMVTWSVENTSVNPARGLTTSWDFEISKVAMPQTDINPQMMRMDYQAFQSGPSVQLRYPTLLPGRSNNLRSACRVELDDPTIVQILGPQQTVNVDDIRVRVRVTVRYTNVRDFSSILFMPWRRGFAIYSRSAEIDIAFKDAGVDQTPRYEIEREGIRVQ